MTYLDRAIKDGYAIITGPENKQKIIYVTSDNHTENYNDPEEKVRAEFWAELIYEYDYPAHRIKVFSSYYKHVQFPIVTFDELKREIQL